MDRISKEKRHKNMSSIKSKNTEIECLLRKELWRRGLHYRKNVKEIYGHPDIVFLSKKIAIFCDSEFFHGFDWSNQKNSIHSNRDFWIPKIERNIERDIEVTEHLTSEGWTVLRFWGKEIKKNTIECADTIERIYRGNEKDESD